MKPRNILTWNTGRPYTEHGQRIAAIALDGGVFMMDADRQVHYFYPKCALDQRAIMRCYDYTLSAEMVPPSIVMRDYEGLIELCAELTAAAEKQ